MKKWIAMALCLCLLLTAVCAALAEENRIWRKGDTGEKVSWIQTRLRDLNYLNREPNGIFDEETEEALLRFQRRCGLLATGMADAVTLSRLESEKQAWNPESERDLDWATEEEAMDGGALFAYVETAAMPAPNYMPAATSLPGAAKSAARGETDWNTDEYAHFEGNAFLTTSTSPLSTFAADVDTSSYAQFRRRVLSGERIPADSVRIEELLNYFHYDYATPAGNDPLGVTLEYGPCPWNEKTRLLQIGLQAKEIQAADRAPRNLVFLIDTSGSMQGADRLDLVKRAFLMLLEELKEEDTVSVVTYASSDRVVIEGVPAREKTRIMEAISDLEARGSTNGSAGLVRAYEIAEKYKKEGGVNRILLATDGDLNVGVTSEGDLARLAEEKRKSGIALTCLGFGMGNYKDNKMEALADYGDGNCWYIDTILEARKALVIEGGGTFETVAKDVKIQVDFNPALVAGYRLIGYENRLLAAEDFANDEKDGGEIGSGHRLTALYEIVPAGSDFAFGAAGSRYAPAPASSPSDAPAVDPSAELLTVSIRAKEPEGTESKLYEYPLRADSFRETLSDNQKFAAAVAETGMLLRNSEWKGSATWDSVLSLLRDCGAVAGDVYKEEFVYLAGLLSRAE